MQSMLIYFSLKQEPWSYGQRCCFALKVRFWWTHVRFYLFLSCFVFFLSFFLKKKWSKWLIWSQKQWLICMILIVIGKKLDREGERNERMVWGKSNSTAEDVSCFIDSLSVWKETQAQGGKKRQQDKRY